jgi:hypothetical protein
LRARLRGRKPPPPFRYRRQGSLATIGRRSAVADFGRVKVTGAAAWGFGAPCTSSSWSAYAIGLLGWVWSYLTFDVGVRLITAGADQRTPRYPSQAYTRKVGGAVSAHCSQKCERLTARAFSATHFRLIDLKWVVNSRLLAGAKRGW